MNCEKCGTDSARSEETMKTYHFQILYFSFINNKRVKTVASFVAKSYIEAETRVRVAYPERQGHTWWFLNSEEK